MKRIAEVRRASYTFVAQAVSSLTNFLPPALVLVSTDLATFGRFALVFQACQLVVTVAQGSLGNSILVHARPQSSGVLARNNFLGGAAAVGLAVGVAFGLVLAGVGLFSSGETRSLLFLAALFAPALVSQYVFRASFFGVERPLTALVIDATWLGVVIFAAIGDWLNLWTMSAHRYLAAWLIGAFVSAAPGMMRGIRAGVRPARGFVEAAGPQSLRLGVEAALARSVFVVTLLGAAMIVDEAASGSLASAVLVFSPLSIFFVGLTSFLVPRLVRQGGIHIPDERAVATIAGAAGLAAGGWMATIAIANTTDLPLGPFDLSENGVATALFLATGARYIALGVWRAPLIALRTADATWESLNVRIAATAMQWSLPMFGFWADGVSGGALGLAIATWLGAGLGLSRWWRLRSDETAVIQSSR